MEAKQTTIRIPETYLARADALVRKVDQDPERGAMGRVTRSTVLRLAMARGLGMLEEEYGGAGRSRGRR